MWNQSEQQMQLEMNVGQMFEALERCQITTRFRIGLWQFDCYSQFGSHLEALRHYVSWEVPLNLGCEEKVYRMFLLTDRDLLEGIQQRLARLSPTRVLETYAGVCFLGQYPLGGEGRSLFFEQGQNADRSYCIVKDGDTVVVLCRETSNDSAESLLRAIPNSPAEYILRAIREIYLRESENHDGVMLHAAGVVRDNFCILFPGNKAAGKTSLTLSLSLSPGYDYLCNDRAVLIPHQEDLFVFPFPLACRIGSGTIEQIPVIKRVLGESLPLYRRQSEALIAHDTSSVQKRHLFGSRIKLSLTPMEITELLPLNHNGGAPLGAIIVPYLDPVCHRPELEPLTAEILAEELSNQAITPSEPQWLTPYLVEHRRTVEDMYSVVDVLLSRVATDTPGYRLRFGFDYWNGRGINNRLLELVDAALK